MFFKNNKGQADIIYYLFRALIAGALILLLILEIGFFTNHKFDDDQLDQKLLVERILNGPQGIAKKDLQGNNVQGTVLLNKLSAKDLEQVFLTSNSKNVNEDLYAARIRLHKSYNDALEMKKPFFKEEFLNAKDARAYTDFAKAGITGRGSANYYLELKPVLVYLTENDDNPKIMWITLEVIRKT